MIYFLVRLLVNALAVGLTIWLLPGIRLEPDLQGPLAQPLVYLFLGLLFGLLNAFVHPFVLLVTGKLLIWTMGLFVIVINGLMFYLLTWLAPSTYSIDSPVLLWVTIAGVVMAVVVTTLEAVLGLDSPVIDDARKSRFYWRWLGFLPEDRRAAIVENLRIMQAYDTFRRYGLDLLVARTPVANLRRSMQRILYPQKMVVIEQNTPETVCLMLEELGPVYVKMGQMFASRTEFLPDEWTRELSRLQSQVSPFAYEEVHRIITEELGAPPEVRFASFAQAPLAAASMAQVHRATLLSGEQVVVKVQRPDIDVTVRGDLKVIQEMVDTMEKRSPEMRNLGLSGMVAEFAASVTQELDYRIEAYNASRLKREMQAFDYVRIPKVYEEYCTSKVITMQYMSGVQANDISALEAEEIDIQELARKLIRVMNKQVLLDGYFHGDPHPGNVLIDLDSGDIVFLDLGMMGQMDEVTRMAMFDIVWSLRYAETHNLTRILLALSEQTRPVDEVQLEIDIDCILQRYMSSPTAETQLSVVVQEALKLLFVHGLVLDRSLSIALKSLMQTEELVRTLAPEISFVDTAVEEVQAVLLGRVKAEVSAENVNRLALQTAKDILVRWPILKRAAGKWMEQLEGGKVTINVDTRDLNKRMDRLDQRINQSVRLVVLGLLLVGMLLGSAIISSISLSDLRFLDFIPQDIFILLFILMAVISLGYVIVSIWSSWRNRKR